MEFEVAQPETAAGTPSSTNLRTWCDSFVLPKPQTEDQMQAVQDHLGGYPQIECITSPKCWMFRAMKQAVMRVRL